jgi:hypothetical protein
VAARLAVRSCLLVNKHIEFGHAAMEALSTTLKRQAVRARRDYEINIRKMTMVRANQLPPPPPPAAATAPPSSDALFTSCSSRWRGSWQVLPPELTWSDFEYEAVEGECRC